MYTLSFLRKTDQKHRWLILHYTDFRPIKCSLEWECPFSQYNLLILSNHHVEIVANKPFYKIQNIFPDL